MGTILVVEDDLTVQQTLEHLFTSAGFDVEVVGDGNSALSAFHSICPNAVILDLQLPGMSGEDICREIKRKAGRIPTVILTAKSDVVDKIVLLEGGAEDYVTKPFSPRELLARVKGAIRRAQSGGNEDLCSFSDIQINFSKMEVARAGASVLLTPQEFKLLRFFCRNPDRVITRDELLNEVWGYDSYPTTRTVDNHVLRLRHKLEPNPSEPVHFRTLHAVGYMFTTSLPTGGSELV